jgi:Astacin (Peptidase family M12A)
MVFKFSDEYQVEEIQWIKEAVALLQNQTCVTFKERTAEDKHYLHLRNKMG